MEAAESRLLLVKNWMLFDGITEECSIISASSRDLLH